MPQKKGIQKVEGSGRQKNVPNKITKTAREIFIATLESRSEFIGEAFDIVRKEDPAKYLELFAKYAQYFVPKKLDVNLEGKVITVIPPNSK